PPRSPTHLRDPHARRRRRPSRDPGAARPRQSLDHAALHARLHRAPGARLRSRAPARRPRARSPSARGGSVSAGARESSRALSRGALGGAVAAVGIALLEARWARSGGDAPSEATFVPTLVACLGVVAPFAFVLAL